MAKTRATTTLRQLHIPPNVTCKAMEATSLYFELLVKMILIKHDYLPIQHKD
jgi:hypothetical protein